MGWSNGQVDGQPARVRQQGSRIEALSGGSGAPDGQGHGHIVANDGVNADFVRHPGGHVAVDANRQDPYAGYQSQSPAHQDGQYGHLPLPPQN